MVSTRTQRIVIEPLTRVEGHGKVTILLDEEGQVEQARLHIVEFRGFERFIQGRPYWELPVVVQRLCGICPVSHHLCAAKAVDRIVGGENLTPTAEKMRRLMHYGQVFQSHALHFFHLASSGRPENTPMIDRILVWGFGNPARLDDGLGPALAANLALLHIDGVAIESSYQLQIEDSALVSEHDAVVFVDADVACDAPFELRRLEPRWTPGFTSHSVAPEGLLALAGQHFGADTAGFLLGIRGYDFDDFGEHLSAGA